LACRIDQAVVLRVPRRLVEGLPAKRFPHQPKNSSPGGKIQEASCVLSPSPSTIQRFRWLRIQ
jgi:hypothetical protein